MPSFLTNPAIGGAVGSFLGNVGADLLEGLGGFGDFLGGAIDTVGGLFDTLQPAINTGLGIAQATGAIGAGAPAGTTLPSPNRPMTSPAVPTMQANFDPGGLVGFNLPQLQLGGGPSASIENLFQSVGRPGVQPGGSMPITINARAGGQVRYPRTVQAMVMTPSGNTRCITYRNMGTPLLYSGDLSAKKRVNRVRGRLGKR